jgi:hypothetical protein
MAAVWSLACLEQYARKLGSVSKNIVGPFKGYAALTDEIIRSIDPDLDRPTR